MFKIQLNLAEQLLRQYEPLNLIVALDIIYYLGEQSDNIIFKNRATTLDKLLTTLYSGYHPRSIQIIFWGGPPTKGRWITGSLYAYLLDRLIRLNVEYGSTAAKRALKYGIKAVK